MKLVFQKINPIKKQLEIVKAVIETCEEQTLKHFLNDLLKE